MTSKGAELHPPEWSPEAHCGPWWPQWQNHVGAEKSDMGRGYIKPKINMHKADAISGV